MNTKTTIVKEISQKLQPELIKQVVEILDTSIEATIEIINLYSDNKYDVANQLLGDLQSMMESIASMTEILASERNHSLVRELYDNVQDTLDNIKILINDGNIQRVAEKVDIQLLPFVRNLRESFYFWGMIYPDKERMDDYYKNEFANNYRNYYVREDGEYEYTLSIVIPAYNHLDVTKRCIEQLLKVTDFGKLNAELILLDHGSSDGTLEYFESLNVGKIVHFKNNVRMYMFTTMAQICKGKYFSYVSNDVLVTKDWAKILINCLKFDDKTIVAVPATPNVCNYQMLEVPTNDPDEFLKWAEKNNKSDSSRWNNRARIIPPLCSYNTSLVSETGFADPLFYSMEFWDDDFSLRARRNGYNQIVCDDVACYHYGSVTGKEFQKKESTLEYGRELFKEKNGVDAWGQGFCYDYQSIVIIKQIIKAVDNTINFLTIDCGFGDTVLQIENELKHNNKAGEIFCINSQEDYNDDLKNIIKNYINTKDLYGAINNYVSNIDFDVVCLDRNLENYDDIDCLFQSITDRMKTNGKCICHCENPYFLMNINNILCLNMGNDRKNLIDFNYIIKTARKYFNGIDVVRMPRSVGGIEKFVERHYQESQNKNEIIDRLSIEKYYFILQK